MKKDVRPNLTIKYMKPVLMVLAALILVMLAGGTAHGAEPIDFDRDISLTVSYQNEATPVVGAEFSVYQIAAVDEYGQPVAAQTFSGYNIPMVNPEGAGGPQARGMASALEGYALRDSLKPLDTGVTDSTGKLRFPQEQDDIEPGVYLLVGQRHTQGDLIYDAEPIVLTLPAQDETTGDWQYDVVVNVKFRTTVTPSQGVTTVRKVLKVWDDAGYEWKRPQKITVQLLCDGSVYDTAVLSADNEWRHTWYGLDGSRQWKVAEEAGSLGDYTVGVVQEGITFVVTNTYQPKSPPPGGSWNPPGGNTPPDTPPGDVTPDDVTPPDENLDVKDPDVPVTEFPDLPEEPEKPKDEKLPQTGQLWWPAGLLAAAGLLLIILGLLRRRGDSYEG